MGTLLRPDGDSDHVPGLVANRRIRRFPIQEDPAGLERPSVPIYLHPDVFLPQPAHRLHGNGQLRRHLLRLWLDVSNGRSASKKMHLFEGAGIARHEGKTPTGEGNAYKALVRGNRVLEPVS